MDKLAVIGLGSISERHRRNLKELFPDSKVIAMSSSGRTLEANPENADLIADNIDALINESPRLVIDASPATFHYSYTKKIIESGIPCLTEKPLSTKVTECDELISSCLEFDSKVSVAYCLRFLPSTSIVKDILKKGELGEIYSVQVSVGQHLSQWRNKDYRQSVSSKKSLGGGVLLELSHELDLLYYLLGEIEFVSSMLSSSKQLGLEVEDSADLMLFSKHGKKQLPISLHMDFLQLKPQRCYSFITEKGRLEFDVISNFVRLIDGKNDAYFYDDADFDKNNMYKDMIRSFIKDDTDVDPRACTLNQARSVVDMIEKAKSYAKR